MQIEDMASAAFLGGSGKETPLIPEMLHDHFALYNVLPC